MKAFLIFLVIAAVGIGIYFLLKARPLARAATPITAPTGGIMGWINDTLKTVGNVTTTVTSTVSAADRVLDTGGDIVDKISDAWNDVF